MASRFEGEKGIRELVTKLKSGSVASFMEKRR